MKKHSSIVILCCILFTGYSVNTYSQNDFLDNYNKKSRAYSAPIGTIKVSNIIGNNSKTYKTEIPVTEKTSKFEVYQSDYIKKNDKPLDHCLYGSEYKKGRSAFFAIIINEEENKYFFSVPNVLLGQLNYEHNKDESVKYISIDKQIDNISFIFYIDSKDNAIENKIKKINKSIKIENKSDLDRILSLLNKYYLIHYTIK